MAFDDRPDSAKRLQLAREAKGIDNPRQAAARFGWVYDTYIQHENGTRGITRSAGKYAKAYGVREGWLLTGEGDPGFSLPASAGKAGQKASATVAPGEIRLGNLRTMKAYVAGRVEAGSWREVDDNDGAERIELDVPEDEEFPRARVLVFEVAGDSMNAYDRAPLVEGNYAVCLAYEDVAHRFVPRDGMVVVVERTRDGGHLREWSIKELRLQDDHYEFHPRSTNPAHKPIIVPIDYEADDGTQVEIIAVLRRVITRTIQF